MPARNASRNGVAGQKPKTRADEDGIPLPNKTTFQFVTFSDPRGMNDHDAISQIRRHAMKEIGKSRRIPKPAKRRITKQRDLLPRKEGDVTEAQPPQLQSYRLGCGGIDPFCQFPVTLDETSRMLVMHSALGPPLMTFCAFRLLTEAAVFSESQKAFRSEWFSISLADGMLPELRGEPSPGKVRQLTTSSSFHFQLSACLLGTARRRQPSTRPPISREYHSPVLPPISRAGCLCPAEQG